MPPAAMPAPPADAAPAATPPALPSPPVNTAAPGADSGPANVPAPSANAPSVNAAPSPPGETSISTAELPQDLSPWGMFVHADIIVKLVMIGLAIASLVTWTVWLAK